MFDLGQARPERGWASLAEQDGLKQMAETHLPYGGPGYHIEEKMERSNILMARMTIVMLTLMDKLDDR